MAEGTRWATFQGLQSNNRSVHLKRAPMRSYAVMDGIPQRSAKFGGFAAGMSATAQLSWQLRRRTMGAVSFSRGTTRRFPSAATGQYMQCCLLLSYSGATWYHLFNMHSIVHDSYLWHTSFSSLAHWQSHHSLHLLRSWLLLPPSQLLVLLR